MKFFSNEKENEAEYAHDDPERTQHVASEPVTVPPQRAGSPWSDRPGDAPASHTDVPASHTDSPADHVDAPDADRERRDGTTYGSSESATTERIDTDQAAIRDDGGFDSPTAVEPETGKPLDSDRASDADSASDVDLALDSDDKNSDQKDAIQDDGTFESPTAVEPETGKPLETEPAAAVPVAAAAGGRLLPDGDAFTERFRDIQLRFVDDPKDATAEASRLVEEVVDKLTSTLKSQRDALGGSADDTEKLRVELRGYRDILNRLLSL
ncbi:hypothetical protein ACQPZJ_06950 [Actinoplanes sp. CA-054009]